MTGTPGGQDRDCNFELLKAANIVATKEELYAIPESEYNDLVGIVQQAPRNQVPVVEDPVFIREIESRDDLLSRLKKPERGKAVNAKADLAEGAAVAVRLIRAHSETVKGVVLSSPVVKLQ